MEEAWDDLDIESASTTILAAHQNLGNTTHNSESEEEDWLADTSGEESCRCSSDETLNRDSARDEEGWDDLEFPDRLLLRTASATDDASSQPATGGKEQRKEEEDDEEDWHLETEDRPSLATSGSGPMLIQRVETPRKGLYLFSLAGGGACQAPKANDD